VHRTRAARARCQEDATTAVYDHTAVLILALDTTTRSGSVAVLRDDTLLAVVEGDGARTHGERLPGEIERVLEAAAVARGDLALLVVASGPGAFTGLRIGLAAIQGLAMVLGTPVVGVSALDALAASVASQLDPGERTLCAWMDAQRGEVFAGGYEIGLEGGPARSWTPRGEPRVGRPQEVLADLTAGRDGGIAFVGDGAERYRAEILSSAPDRVRLLPVPTALAPALGRIGRARAARGEAGPPHALQPLYVRRPDAELERQRRLS
jgi:tRNA threonylcarbamoyladenosine biosynthesis protein TsaB